MSGEQIKPGYKRTEVGVIPEDWSLVAAGEIGRFRGGSGFPTKHQGGISGMHPFFKVSDMNNEGNETYMRTANNYIGETTRKALGANLFQKNSIVFAKVGAAVFLERKKILAQQSCLDNNMAAYELDEKKADYRFIHYRLLHTKFGDLVSTTALPSLSGAVLYKISFPLPSLPEQRAIATALSDVDALLTKIDQLIGKKRDLKQAAMQQLLTGQTRLPGFSGDWMDVLVGDVISRHFSGPSPTCQERNIEGDSEWGVLKTTASTKESGWDWRKHKALPSAYWDSDHIELQAGDVIVTKAGPRHRVGVAAWVDYIPRRIIPSGKMIALRPNERKVLPLMLAYGISEKGAQSFLDQRTTGMAESQVNFENGDLLNTPIHIPAIEEQMAISEIISGLDTEITTLEARRDKTRALKQGMMQELLTGRIRLV